MASWKSLKVQETLLQKGFQRKNNSDARFYLYVDGKLTGIGTTVSHGRFDIVSGRFPFTEMKKQMHLSPSELAEFLDCTLTGESYVALLRERKHISD